MFQTDSEYKVENIQYVMACTFEKFVLPFSVISEMYVTF